MLDSQFYTKRGRLTSYALACGYIEKHYDNSQSVTLWYEGSVYHVRHFDHKLIKWYLDSCYETLTEARKAFDTCVKNV